MDDRLKVRVRSRRESASEVRAMMMKGLRLRLRFMEEGETSCEHEGEVAGKGV